LWPQKSAPLPARASTHKILGRILFCARCAFLRLEKFDQKWPEFLPQKDPKGAKKDACEGPDIPAL
jgi:hypothetical protein